MRNRAQRTSNRARSSSSPISQANRRNRDNKSRGGLSPAQQSRRRVTRRNLALPFSPPEDWHEPAGEGDTYQIIEQHPGSGYRHVVTSHEVRERLAELPGYFLRDLEVVQLSRMTRKKQSLPCYGMQWGPTLYLYPIDESLVEYFHQPPGASVITETKMYGGRWIEESGSWKLVWTEATIRDFYLNNILIHELGHLLDERNRSYTDRERFAEWFATEFGYRSTGGAASRRPRQKVHRRHHTS